MLFLAFLISLSISSSRPVSETCNEKRVSTVWGFVAASAALMLQGCGQPDPVSFPCLQGGKCWSMFAGETYTCAQRILYLTQENQEKGWGGASLSKAAFDVRDQFQTCTLTPDEAFEQGLGIVSGDPNEERQAPPVCMDSKCTYSRRVVACSSAVSILGTSFNLNADRPDGFCSKGDSKCVNEMVAKTIRTFYGCQDYSSPPTSSEYFQKQLEIRASRLACKDESSCSQITHPVTGDLCSKSIQFVIDNSRGMVSFEEAAKNVYIESGGACRDTTTSASELLQMNKKSKRVVQINDVPESVAKKAGVAFGVSDQWAPTFVNEKSTAGMIDTQMWEAATMLHNWKDVQHVRVYANSKWDGENVLNIALITAFALAGKDLALDIGQDGLRYDQKYGSPEEWFQKLFDQLARLPPQVKGRIKQLIFFNEHALHASDGIVNGKSDFVYECFKKGSSLLQKYLPDAKLLIVHLNSVGSFFDPTYEDTTREYLQYLSDHKIPLGLNVYAPQHWPEATKLAPLSSVVGEWHARMKEFMKTDAVPKIFLGEIGSRVPGCNPSEEARAKHLRDVMQFVALDVLDENPILEGTADLFRYSM